MTSYINSVLPRAGLWIAAFCLLGMSTIFVMRMNQQQVTQGDVQEMQRIIVDRQSIIMEQLNRIERQTGIAQ